MTTPQEPAMGVKNGQLPPTASNDVERAFDAGWLLAARWAERDDLHCDMDSPAYQRDRAALLAALPHMQPAGEAVKYVRWHPKHGFNWKNLDDEAYEANCEWQSVPLFTTPPQPSAEPQQETGDDYETRYATAERLAMPPATQPCDFCGARSGDLHSFDCVALDKPQQEVESDECPNCVSPWKCNGPHIGLAPKHGYGDEDPQQEAQGAVAFEQPKAIELAVAAYLAAQEEGDSLYACVSEACAAYAQTTQPAPVDVRRAREVLSSWRVDAENDDHPDYTAEERAGIAAMADEMEAALFAQQPSADARDGERWRAMRENLVAVDFAPEIGGGPVVMFACHADRAHAGPTGADAIADAAIAAQREAQSA